MHLELVIGRQDQTTAWGVPQSKKAPEAAPHVKKIKAFQACRVRYETRTKKWVVSTLAAFPAALFDALLR